MFIIDNGTYECKTNIKKTKKKFHNRIYKTGQIISNTPIPNSTLRYMFDGDWITNTDTLKMTLEHILKDYKKINNLIFTIKPNLPSICKKEILIILFEYFKIDFVQLGYDYIYSYLSCVNNYNLPNNLYNLIISISYSGIHLSVIGNKEIIETFKLNLGSHNILKIGHKLLKLRKINTKEKLNIKKFKVALDYDKDCLNVFKKYYYKINNSINIKKINNSINDNKREEIKNEGKSEDEIENKGKSEDREDLESETGEYESEVEDLKNEDEGLLNEDEGLKNEDERLLDEDEELKNEDGVNEEDGLNEALEDKNESNNVEDQSLITVDEDAKQKKEEKRKKLIYYSSLYRSKQKIKLLIEKIKIKLNENEIKIEKTKNPEKYLKKIKIKIIEIKKKLKKMKSLKLKLRDKKSQEYGVLYKYSSGHELLDFELEIYNDILELDNEEYFIKEFEILKIELMQIDYQFLIDFNLLDFNVMDYFYGNHEENINNEHFNQNNNFIKHNENLYLKNNIDCNILNEIDIFRITESIFEPSIINLKQMGIIEIFENIKKYEISKVFITGGFSKLKNLIERIKLEFEKIYKKEVEYLISNDVFNSVNFESFTDYFPVFSRDEYFNLGPDEILKKYDF